MWGWRGAGEPPYASPDVPATVPEWEAAMHSRPGPFQNPVVPVYGMIFRPSKRRVDKSPFVRAWVRPPQVRNYETDEQQQLYPDASTALVFVATPSPRGRKTRTPLGLFPPPLLLGKPRA